MENRIFNYLRRVFFVKLSRRLRVPLVLFVGPLVSLLGSLGAMYFIRSVAEVTL